MYACQHFLDYAGEAKQTGQVIIIQVTEENRIFGEAIAENN